jgi:hypothetical protein
MTDFQLHRVARAGYTESKNSPCWWLCSLFSLLAALWEFPVMYVEDKSVDSFQLK